MAGLVREGRVVIRVAGSKPIDLIAFRGGAIRFIECKKRGHVPKEQKGHQEGLARRAGATYIVVTPKNFKQLSLIFRVGIVTLDGKKLITNLVESRVRRRVVYRNNIKEYVRVCLNMMVPGVDRTVVDRVLNEIYSFVYGL